ncbi:carbohydrate kinase family protein [Bifidobacterium aerophilum]|uniref:Carbohydrate kinase PfkB domain-containing protein n=1 Tax=Bifidobacterium aerophilum TaxID=1798155 RepID=A0A6N9Z1X3_9BIFI|nr:carbohydrate kinase family protein [Bifidobacterium aerophilum]NEG88568.1 hypothetical protein [Bifidobacterium aerophilum]
MNEAKPNATMPAAAHTDILAVCGIALDVVAKVDHLPVLDGFCSVLSTQRQYGGGGMNVLMQASRIGVRTGIVTKLANDADSDFLIANMDKLGIDHRGVVRRPGDYKAPTCLIYVDPEGRKMMVGDMERLPGPIVESEFPFDLIAQTDVVYLDFNPAPLTPMIAETAKRQGKTVVLNFQDGLDSVTGRGITAQQTLDMLRYVDVFAPCQEAIRALSGTDDVDGQLAFIRQYHRGLVVLTLGERGVVAFDEQDRRTEIPAYGIDPVDTTGAGDSFIGAFMTEYLVRRHPLAQSLRYATACAALTCTKLGAQSSPTAGQVDAFIAERGLPGVAEPSREEARA